MEIGAVISISRVITIVINLVIAFRIVRYNVNYWILLSVFGTVFSIIPLLSIPIIYNVCRQFEYFFIIKTETEKLNRDRLRNADVEAYINKIDKLKNIPNTSDTWNTLRGGYTIIKDEQQINPELKYSLKKLLLSKGVNGLH